MSNRAYLILENGKVFEGKYFGYESEVTGEIVFSTSMTGYLETITDQSYYGQIVVQTFPLIGNYGVIPQDFESGSVGVSAYIVKEWCQEPSNFRSEGNLDTFFKEQKVTGLYGIDTRALTRIIREHGVLNGRICRNLPDDLEEVKSYKIVKAVESVSTKNKYVENSGGKYRVALLDFGLKQNIVRELAKRDCEVIVFPHNTTADEILAEKPDGIMLSNGPGDPTENTETIKNLSVLTEQNIPIFGICLGHQLLALSHGFETTKLKYGHRGANQPVKNIFTGRVYITSQNHGYAVKSDSIDEKKARLWFENANDNTCEGIIYKNKPVCSVQFHPEACGGPLDTVFLFDDFIKEIESHAVKSAL